MIPIRVKVFPWVLLTIFVVLLGLIQPRPASAQINQPPSLSTVREQILYPGGTTGPLPFQVADAETDAAALLVQALSTNTALVPVSNIVLGGLGSQRTVTVTSLPGRTGVTQVTLTVTDASGATASNQFLVWVEEFTEVTLLPAALSVTLAVWGDFDADGDLDALVGGSTNYQFNVYPFTQVYRNDGSNALVALPTALPSVSDAAGAWGDFDNDGDLDLVVSGYRYDVYLTEVHRNEGDGVFSKVAALPGVLGGAAAWADVDNDGDLDLLLSGVRATGLPDVTWIFRNDGGAFMRIESALPGLWAYASLEPADFDRDGDADLLLAGGGKTGVFRNDGAGQFTGWGVELPVALYTGWASELPGVLYGVARAGDYDADGLVDLLIAGDSTAISGSPTEVSRIYRNVGGGAFTNINAPLVPLNFATGAWGDWDNDGDLDVTLAGDPGSTYLSSLTRLYRNQAGVFSLAISNLPYVGSSTAMTAGDYDADGDLDVLMDGRVLRNNLNRRNAAPSAPTGLTALLLPNQDLLFTWEPARDVETTNEAGLSYNLRVGTTPGGRDVMSPQSHPVTAQRLVPESGPARSSGWRLIDLPRGTYYWSVQAVDAGLAASPFAEEVSFSITNSPPRISKIPDQSTFPNQLPRPIVFTVEDSETPAEQLVVSAHSSNTNLVPAASFVFTGSGTNRALTLSVAPGGHGSSRITVTVTDTEGRTRSMQFTFRLEEFTALVPGLSGFLVGQGLAAWGDYDADGWLDVKTGYTLLRNLGGSFALNGQSGTSPNTAWADYDHDGLLDFVSGNRLFRNRGNGAFTNFTVGTLLDRFTHAAWGDYDNDGRLDVLMLGEDANHAQRVRIFRNLGNGALADVNAPLLTANGTGAWGDTDNDGDMDLIVSGFALGTGRATRLYRNDNNGVFVSVPLPFSGFSASSLAWGDYDNDGDLDLLITGEVTINSYGTRLYRNTGSNTFVNVPTPFAGMQGPSPVVAWGDYDNDGWLDAYMGLLGPATNLYRFFRNVGGTFVDTHQDLFGASALGDWDNDGDLDLTTGYGGVLFQNNAATPNPPPNVPTGLTTTTVLTRVTFSWSPATDPNQVGGHSYNLRVGRSPGASDVMVSMSELATGHRHLPALGNAGPGTSWFLTNLAVGTYYWSVQAVDHSFAGSAWAAEQSFVIPEQPPIAITDGATNIGLADATLEGRVNPNKFAGAFRFEYGLTTSYGSVTDWQSVSSGTNLNAVAASIAGLEVGRTYHFRIVATNQQGAIAGADRVFTTRAFVSVPAGIGLPGSPASAWGDYDNDNDLDLLVTGTPATRLYRNDGLGRLSDAGLTLPSVQDGAVAWGDYDNDGRLDFVIAGNTNTVNSPAAFTRLYRNNGAGTGTGTFSPVNTCLPALLFPALAWGDHDNDGRLELLVSGLNNGNYLTAIYRRAPGCVLEPVPATLAGVIDGAVAWGDYDNDGDLDIVVSGRPSFSTAYGFASVYRNDGKDGFVRAGPTLPDLWQSSVAWGDLDNDGDLDLLLTGWRNAASYSAATVVYHNDGQDSFTPLVTPLPGVYGGHGGWGDFDNDGFLDVLLTGSANVTGVSPTVFRGFGDGNFLNIGVGFSLPGGAFTAGWADHDRDGDLDYLMVSGSVFHENRITTSNAPPSAPGNLTALLEPGNQMLLSWAPASDPETSDPRGLSYSVRVGLSPGGSEVVPAWADPVTGRRRVSAKGELQTTNWRLQGLSRGIYYWSVQTVDGGLAASPFAPEGTFTITNSPPNISFIADRGSPPGELSQPIPFVLTDEEGDLGNIVLTATSSQTSLVRNASIIFGGSGSNRTVTLQPEAGAVGTTTITISALDEGGLSASRSFRFSVAHFAAVNAQILGVRNASAEWGDVDNDGDLDLAFSGRAAGGDVTKVYRNQGAGFFQEFDAGVPPGLAGMVAWGDYDNDNDLDLLVAAGPLLLQQNDGTGNFTSILIPLPGSGTPAWGDYDNDGDLDILLCGGSTSQGYTRIYRNRGGNQFEAVTTGLPNLYMKARGVWGDADGDGDLDVLLMGNAGGLSWITRLYRNDGGGGFSDMNNGFPGLGDACAAFGDYDNDGDLDLVLSGAVNGQYATNALKTLLYRNNGTGVFAEVPADLPGASWGSVAWGDYDGDGRRDLLLTGSTTRNTSYNTTIARVYQNHGDGAFSELAVSLPGTHHGLGIWGDSDRDGDLDIFLAGQQGEYEAMSRLYRNNWNRASGGPAPPDQLVASVSGAQAILTWENGGKNGPGIGFNLRVGTRPGGSEIVSPSSDPVTGRRRLSQNGPALNRWKLTNLRPGRYYWSVQGIDGALVGSVFAPEKEFVVGGGAWFTDPRVADGTLEFLLEGLPGETYVIDISSDLTTWIPWRTAPLPNGSLLITTPAPTGPAFYRARLVE